MNKKLTELIIDALKPSWLILFLTGFFATWQFFYSYLGFRIESLPTVLRLLGIGLGSINWNNYFIRSSSLVVLWLIVAFTIFAIIWLTEIISVWSHNRKIKSEYINEKPKDYSHLLKYSTVTFGKHFINRLLSTLPYALLGLGLFIVSDILENLRFLVAGVLMVNLSENGVRVYYGSVPLLVVGFAVTAFIWYLYSGIIVFIHRLAKERKEATEIADEHFVVVVEDNDTETGREGV